MMQQPAFGERLRELRQARRLSQTELAGDKISTSYISRLESGERPPTPQIVALLASRLGVSAAELGDVGRGEFAEIIARGFNRLNEIDSAVTSEMVLAQTSADAVVQWQLLWGLSEAYGQANDIAGQREALDALLALSDVMAAPTLRVRARAQVARFLRVRGEIPRSVELGREALEIARGGDIAPIHMARTLLIAIAAEAEAGNVADAWTLATELLAIVDADATLPRTLVAEARWTVATVHLRGGRAEDAAALMTHAIHQFDSHDDLMLWIRLRIAAASMYMQMADQRVADARAVLDELAPVLALVAGPEQVQQVKVLRAEIALYEGRRDDAHRLADELASDGSHLGFREQVRMDILRFRLQLESGSAQLALDNLAALATRLQESSNAELATKAWAALADAVRATRP